MDAELRASVERGRKEGREEVLRDFIKMLRASGMLDDEIFVKVKQFSSFQIQIFGDY